ncbi:MAG: hypothetical protein EOP11_01555 [Proteobacteria bacterium]|nr:MAG: hypothetical protein EOP11_01555 [Pseudomonadota bacterium]
MRILSLVLIAATAATAATATAAASAATAETRVYQFKGEKIEFVDEPADHLTISKGCVNKKTKPACAATKELAKLSLAKIQAAHPGTEAASSLLCEEQLKGVVVLGKSEIGDENAFCRFPADASLIDLGSLLYRARQNDKGSPKS